MSNTVTTYDSDDPAQLIKAGAGAITAALKQQAISATDLTQYVLAWSAQSNRSINAFNELYTDDAFSAASRIDTALAEGRPVGPLAGVPVAVKDLTPLKGKRTTLGSLVYENTVGAFDPVYVARLRSAGAIIIGKTNTPEFAHASFCSNRVFGTTRNPWHLERTPGGSSGGAGAVVAAGCVPMAEGTDMGGSVRIPAAFCGLVGLKPSFGRIPMDILPSVFDTISHFGPITRTVEDTWRFLEITKGPDDSDPFSLPEQTIAFDRDADIRGTRIAYSADLGFYAVDADVRRNLERTVACLQEQGAVVEYIDIPWDHEVYSTAMAIWDVFMGGFHGKLLDKHRSELDPLTADMMDRAADLDAVTAKRYELVRTHLWRDLLDVFHNHDALLCPTTPSAAPSVARTDRDYGHKDAQGRTVSPDMTAPFNLVPHCPAITVPSGVDKCGLPTGAQFIGRRFDEATVLRLARAVERTNPLSGHVPGLMNEPSRYA